MVRSDAQKRAEKKYESTNLQVRSRRKRKRDDTRSRKDYVSRKRLQQQAEAREKKRMLLEQPAQVDSPTLAQESAMLADVDTFFGGQSDGVLADAMQEIDTAVPAALCMPAHERDIRAREADLLLREAAVSQREAVADSMLPAQPSKCSTQQGAARPSRGELASRSSSCHSLARRRGDMQINPRLPFAAGASQTSVLPGRDSGRDPAALEPSAVGSSSSSVRPLSCPLGSVMGCAPPGQTRPATDGQMRVVTLVAMKGLIRPLERASDVLGSQPQLEMQRRIKTRLFQS